MKAIQETAKMITHKWLPNNMKNSIGQGHLLYHIRDQDLPQYQDQDRNLFQDPNQDQDLFPYPGQNQDQDQIPDRISILDHHHL